MHKPIVILAGEHDVLIAKHLRDRLILRDIEAEIILIDHIASAREYQIAQEAIAGLFVWGERSKVEDWMASRIRPIVGAKPMLLAVSARARSLPPSMLRLKSVEFDDAEPNALSEVIETFAAETYECALSLQQGDNPSEPRFSQLPSIVANPDWPVLPWLADAEAEQDQLRARAFVKPSSEPGNKDGQSDRSLSSEAPPASADSEPHISVGYLANGAVVSKVRQPAPDFSKRSTNASFQALKFSNSTPFSGREADVYIWRGNGAVLPNAHDAILRAQQLASDYNQLLRPARDLHQAILLGAVYGISRTPFDAANADALLFTCDQRYPFDAISRHQIAKDEPGFTEFIGPFATENVPIDLYQTLLSVAIIGTSIRGGNIGLGNDKIGCWPSETFGGFNSGSFQSYDYHRMPALPPNVHPKISALEVHFHRTYKDQNEAPLRQHGLAFWNRQTVFNDAQNVFDLAMDAKLLSDGRVCRVSLPGFERYGAVDLVNDIIQRKSYVLDLLFGGSSQIDPTPNAAFKFRRDA